ncbi:MAG TPA: hypothetical protein V6D02_04565 [Candidatus Obscuribacterales bacterium]
MVWVQGHQTPRVVWAGSAIATTLLHGGLLWWGLTLWHSTRELAVPAPIKVIALPPATEMPQETGAIADLPASPDQAFAPVAPTDFAPAVEAVPTTPPAQDAPAPPVPSATTGATSPPSPPVAPVPPATSPPVTNPPTTNPPATNPPPSGGDAGRGVQAFAGVQAVPEGADLPERLPVAPSGWQADMAALVADAPCVARWVAPGTAARVTLWPFVEADGSISGFQPWRSSENNGDEDLIACVESLAAQMPPLIPAADNGVPRPSYAVLFEVEVRANP